MKSLFPDTSLEAEAFLLAGYRKMTAGKKVQLLADLNLTLKTLQLAEIQAKYPDASAYELKMRLASRWIDPELMKQAFGWDVVEKGY